MNIHTCCKQLLHIAQKPTWSDGCQHCDRRMGQSQGGKQRPQYKSTAAPYVPAHMATHNPRQRVDICSQACTHVCMHVYKVVFMERPFAQFSRTCRYTSLTNSDSALEERDPWIVESNLRACML